MMDPELLRCAWCSSDPVYIGYHDQEWGRPVHDDGILFEFLLLEGAQAGLSWITILKRREHYRRAFSGFDPQKVAAFGQAEEALLLQNEGIIRNRSKIGSAISNARLFLKIQAEFGTFDAYLWGFMPGKKPLINHWKHAAEVPVTTGLSDAISKDMKSRGFSFFGPVICYAFMQATGMVNDHLAGCWLYTPIRVL